MSQPDGQTSEITLSTPDVGPETIKQDAKHPTLALIDGLAIRLIFLGLIVLIGVFARSLIDHQSTPYWALSRSSDAALMDANDRIIQLSQWVIGTVLLVGTALIGLNWYQGEKRYQTDRENDTKRLSAIEQQIRTLSDEIHDLQHNHRTVDSTLLRAQRLLDFLDQAHELNASDRFLIIDDRLDRLVQNYGEGDDNAKRKKVVYVTEVLRRERALVLEQMRRQYGKDETVRNAINRCVVTFRPDYPDEAREIETIIGQLDTIVRLSGISQEEPIDFRG